MRTTDASTVVSLEMNATPERIFEVLADGYSYDDWVVGAKKIHSVDPGWPAEGSHFHHEMGVGPVSLEDSSKVILVARPNHLVLDVRFRPAGTAIVDLKLEPLGSTRTRVVMTETATSGAARRLGPITTLMLVVRNKWSLRRLRRLVTRHIATR